MKPENKDYEMKRFVEAKTKILVSTTFVEVGVDVPNASVIIIESAERFGLSQLHQLRGRVGRGKKQSYCILMTKYDISKESKERIKAIEDQIKTLDPSLRTQKLEERLAILSGNVAVISIGANSDVEFKEKKDRVDDAIHATKAAVKEGIVPGGGVALLNAANNIKEKTEGTNIFTEAIKYPYKTILKNAGLEYVPQKGKGKGINVITGETVNMINEGIIDPLLVTKSALKNAVSVATTILSTDCVISNMREE